MYSDAVGVAKSLVCSTNVTVRGEGKTYHKGKVAGVALGILVVGAFLFVYSIFYATALGGSIQASLGKNTDILAGRLGIFALILGGLHITHGAPTILYRGSKFTHLKPRGKLDLAVRINTFIAAVVTLVLGALYVCPQKIINLRQLGQGLIGSLVVPTACSIIYSTASYIAFRPRAKAKAG